MAQTAEEMAASYQAGMSSSATKQRYVQGINNTQVNPMEQAAAADDLFLKRVEESVRSGRRRTALLAVPFSTWKANAAGEGANRLQSGAAKAKDKVLNHFRKFKPVYDSIKAEAATMPKGTVDEQLEIVRMSITRLRAAAGKS